MSQSKNRYQTERWLRTAEEDLQAAQILSDSGKYAQACFYAQQSAEKALKALWHAVDADPWGNSVQRLVTDFPRRSEIANVDTWIARAGLLDQFYIPTRYPNGLPDLTPGQVYGLEDARRGLDAAQALVDACKDWLGRH